MQEFLLSTGVGIWYPENYKSDDTVFIILNHSKKTMGFSGILSYYDVDASNLVSKLSMKLFVNDIFKVDI